jgi:hypothetical protein
MEMADKLNRHETVVDEHMVDKLNRHETVVDDDMVAFVEVPSNLSSFFMTV